MADDLQQMAGFIEPLVKKLSPAERKRLMRDLIRTLRQRNQQRIRAQKNIDGSPYAPRKKNLRSKTGRIRNAPMFAKLRQAKYLRISATSDDAAIRITGSAGKIATIHHKGLRAYVSRRMGTKTEYPERNILGFTESDKDLVLDVVLKHLTPR